MVNPADIPTTDKERDQKDDTRDSRKIARSLKNKELQAIYVPSLRALEDRTLVRSRSMLVKDIQDIKTALNHFYIFMDVNSDSFIKSSTNWSNNFIYWLGNIDMTEKSGKESLNLLINNEIYEYHYFK